MTSNEENKLVATHIIQRLGEGGQPPEFGLSRINVGNESYLNVLEHEYFNALLKQGSSFKLVQGYFGGGKTHFLHCVRELAWKYGFVSSLIELSPTECPYDDALKVYQNVARHITTKPESIFAPPEFGIGNIIRNIVDQKLHAYAGQADRASHEVQRWITSSLGRSWCESHSYRQAVMLMALSYLQGDYAREQRLEAWLIGENINISELKDDGVYEQMSRSNGFTMLRSLLQMIVALGLPGSVLLFDEVDRNLSVSAKRSHIIGDNLRQVVDLCGRHQLPRTLFVYAVPPEFMRTVVPDYPALYQRLKSPVALSARSPQAVLIDLEKLDLAPADLLTKIGEKLVSVFEDARDVTFNHEMQAENARRIAQALTDAYFEVNHRRLFVKTWVDFLYTQLADGESLLTPEAIADMIWNEQRAFSEQTEKEEEFDDF